MTASFHKNSSYKRTDEKYDTDDMAANVYIGNFDALHCSVLLKRSDSDNANISQSVCINLRRMIMESGEIQSGNGQYGQCQCLTQL